MTFTIIIIILLIYIINEKKRSTKIEDYLNSLLKTIKSIRYGNLSAKIEAPTYPEYKNITDSINRMTETLQDREQMILEYQTELTEKNELLESGINALSDGILLLDKNANIIKITPKVSAWFETNDKKLINKNIFEYIKPVQETNIKDFNNTPIVITNNVANNFVMSTNIINAESENYRIVAIIKDITREKEIENLKEDFVATLTHDLKVPIVAEANMLEFLLENRFGEISDKQRTALINMQASNKELLELVQILLETYKVGETGIDLFKEEIDLNTFIAAIISEMQPTASKYNIEIHFDCQQEIILNADKIQFARVIKNLISNAIFHSNTQGIVDITAKCENSDIIVSVTDYGGGISPDKISFIFDKYYSATDKYRKTGTGLGLYLSQQIIHSHGGEITVTSEENVKTTFCVKLPAQTI